MKKVIFFFSQKGKKSLLYKQLIYKDAARLINILSGSLYLSCQVDGDEYICDYYSVDYSSNMDTDVVISIIIINNVDYYDISSASGPDTRMTHMKNSGEDGLSLVEPASRNPFAPVSFSHFSLYASLSRASRLISCLSCST